ncbi:MAG: hypothetical protein DDT34_02278 [Firmicutes bacterium]|nr:hypothetical protein [Bacillota bacterium]
MIALQLFTKREILLNLFTSERDAEYGLLVLLSRRELHWHTNQRRGVNLVGLGVLCVLETTKHQIQHVGTRLLQRKPCFTIDFAKVLG